jgi:Flp pilus assembly protein TadG
MKRIITKLKEEKGQSAVEFALVVIPLLLLLFGIIEFGRAWFRADLLKNAANVAARSCAVTKVQATAIAAGRAAIPNYSDPPTHIIVPDCAALAPMSQVTTTVTETFTSILSGFIPKKLVKNWTLTRTATYRMEQ